LLFRDIFLGKVLVTVNRLFRKANKRKGQANLPALLLKGKKEGGKTTHLSIRWGGGMTAGAQGKRCERWDSKSGILSVWWNGYMAAGSKRRKGKGHERHLK